MSNSPISPKVTAGAGAGGAGLALGVIVVWLLTYNGIEVPSEVASAIGSLLSMGLGAFSAYRKRDPLREDEYVPEHARRVKNPPEM